jgi:hypothetical protein
VTFPTSKSTSCLVITNRKKLSGVVRDIVVVYVSICWSLELSNKPFCLQSLYQTGKIVRLSSYQRIYTSCRLVSSASSFLVRSFSIVLSVSTSAASTPSASRIATSMSASPSKKSIQRKTSTHKLVGYVTDIEGNFDYWKRYIALSKVLRRNKATGALELCDNSQLVFGGDVCDRGPGDLRVVRELVQLKRKYPERVHFILGNRDVNKLRLDVELQTCNLKASGQVYWIDSPSEPGQSAADRLKWVRIRVPLCRRTNRALLCPIVCRYCCEPWVHQAPLNTEGKNCRSSSCPAQTTMSCARTWTGWHLPAKWLSSSRTAKWRLLLTILSFVMEPSSQPMSGKLDYTGTCCLI